MKRALLLFGLASFTGISAQTQDLFDINKHLEKKSNLTTRKVSLTQKIFKIPNIEINKLVHVFTLPNGDKVVSSPKYNMPIVTPGNNFIYYMPTSYMPFYKDFLSKLPGRMPNGSVEYNLSIIR
jgi:hypothetical protein